MGIEVEVAGEGMLAHLRLKKAVGNFGCEDSYEAKWRKYGMVSRSWVGGRHFLSTVWRVKCLRAAVRGQR